MKWMSSLRASTSRSYSTPLTVTVTALDDATRRHSAPLRRLAGGAHGEHLREMRAVLARRVDVGGRIEAGAAHRFAHGVLVGRAGCDDDRHRVDAAERDAHASR